MFTEAELVDLRRFCGYPVYGNVSTGQQSYRFFVAYGAMEYRLANLQAEEMAVVRTTYLTNLYALENAIVGAAANLDTEKAAVWTRNANEVSDRTRLFNDWRRRLCGFLGIPPGPELGAGSIAVDLVV